MKNQWLLSPERPLTEDEKKLVWQKPLSHIESEGERRICAEVKRNWQRGEMKIANILLEGDAGSGKTQLAKALSADFGLPYTKITCFADMDKSDVLGSILPVLPEDSYDIHDGSYDIHDGSAGHEAHEAHKAHKAHKAHRAGDVSYQFYPSEIVRAYENGWLLEIQEPTVIRDAAVLMALNSALEPEGSINLPTRIVHRHPDFIAVITTNRGYNGCRPLNEALRDRVQHTEKMDLPPKAVMMERAAAKTGYGNERVLSLLADIIITLDETAKANAIKGVAGMRSYLFWADAVANGCAPRPAMYYKVIYKITTEPEEVVILEQALAVKGLLEKLAELEALELPEEQLEKPVQLKPMARSEEAGQVQPTQPNEQAEYTELAEGTEQAEQAGSGKSHSRESQKPDVMELKIDEDGEYLLAEEHPLNPDAVRLRKAAESKGHSKQTSDTSSASQSNVNGADGSPIYHEVQDQKIKPDGLTEHQKQAFRKSLNEEARASVQGSIHQHIKLIVHRPEPTGENKREYLKQAAVLMPVIRELIQKTTPLLEYETASELAKGRLYGTMFSAERVAAQDFRYFARKRPPEENPTLAVALRIDESASMTAFGRLEAARQAAIALYEFCTGCGIPVMIYGDTADRSRLEQMSLYAYVDFAGQDPEEKYSLLGIQGRSNNRDGMALRIIADRLLKAPQQTKLFISLSDGQPKAMPDYTGDLAAADMKKTLQEYRRKGILFLAAAIGQDKEIISDIYGQENTLDITDLQLLPARLVQIIARYL